MKTLLYFRDQYRHRMYNHCVQFEETKDVCETRMSFHLKQIPRNEYKLQKKEHF